MHVCSLIFKTVGLCFFLFLSKSLAVAANSCESFYLSENKPKPKAKERLLIGDMVTAEIMTVLTLAKSEILLEMSNVAGKGVEDILIQKKKEGVKVKVILDNRHALKGGERKKAFEESVEKLRSHGIEVAISKNEELSRFRGYPKSFLHRKILIVDRRYSYVGSANLGYNTNFEIGLFSEYSNITKLVELFNFDLESIRNGWDVASTNKPKPPVMSDSSTTLIGPGTSKPDIRTEVIDLISKAKHQILLSSYEASDKKVLRALIEKKRKNPELDIRILLCSSKGNIWFGTRLFKVTKSAEFKNTLMKAGIEVRELEIPEQYNHSRFIVSDHSTIGMSADFSQRSFDGNIDLGFRSIDPSLKGSAVKGFEALWDISSPAKKAKPLEYYYDKMIQFNEKVLSLWMRLG